MLVLVTGKGIMIIKRMAKYLEERKMRRGRLCIAMHKKKSRLGKSGVGGEQVTSWRHGEVFIFFFA